MFGHTLAPVANKDLEVNQSQHDEKS